jgi:hypothetical protein
MMEVPTSNVRQVMVQVSTRVVGEVGAVHDRVDHRQLGTRFVAHMGKADMEMVVEVTEFERPHLLGSLATSSTMETFGALTLTAEGDETVMGWDWQVRPKGWFRLLGPLVGPLGRRHGAQDLDWAEAQARKRWRRSHVLTGHNSPHPMTQSRVSWCGA